MFQELINGSVAVLTRPSVSTFEEHERDNLGGALIYSIIGALIVGLVTAATGQLVYVDPATNETIQLPFLPAFFLILVLSIVSLFISYGLTYGLGRAFSGTGKFGELTWDMALFGVPLGIVSAALGAIPFVGWILGLALLAYNLFLTYLAIQSGMNLPSNKALYVILIQFGLMLFLIACVLFSIVIVIAALVSTGMQG